MIYYLFGGDFNAPATDALGQLHLLGQLCLNLNFVYVVCEEALLFCIFLGQIGADHQSKIKPSVDEIIKHTRQQQFST